MQRINRSARLVAVISLAVTFALGLFLCPAVAGDKDEKAADIHQLASIDDLKKVVKEHDYLFVILPAPEKDTGSIQQIALAATKKAEADDVVVCVAELSRDCKGFKKFAKKSKVKKFPAVLVYKKDGAVGMVHDGITQEKLVKAYAELAEADSNTCPFASKHSNCDPTACGFKK